MYSHEEELPEPRVGSDGLDHAFKTQQLECEPFDVKEEDIEETQQSSDEVPNGQYRTLESAEVIQTL